MRTIKYKAYFKKFKEMFDVSAIFIYDGMVRLDRKWDSLIPIQQLELLQFTGMLDKNGREIYEGYLIGNGLFVAEVFYDEGKAAFCWRNKANTENLMIYNSVNRALFEVIGDIYRNPELLK